VRDVVWAVRWREAISTSDLPVPSDVPVTRSSCRSVLPPSAVVNVFGDQLWPSDGERQIVELAGEAERNLVVVGYTGAPVSAPMSKFSSHCIKSGMVRATLWRAPAQPQA
jgi:hypothetical protein